MKEVVYGYVRVSTREQNADRQLIALHEAGVADEHIFIDRQSGKDFDRPAYRRLMRVLRPGNTVILKSLDRLGRNYEEVLAQWRIITKEKSAHVYIIDTPIIDTRRSRDLVGTLLSDLMLAVFSCVAEMERDFNSQRQAEGIAAARRRGVRFGRKPQPRPERFPTLCAAWKQGTISARSAAAELGITHRTFLRWARENG